MKYRHVFTGSAETEGELKTFLTAADTLDGGVARKLFADTYLWKVMTEGRNGATDAYPGSTAFDDTGGFFEVRNSRVYLTDKAKGCIRV